MIAKRSSALLCVLLFPLLSSAQQSPASDLPMGAIARLGNLRFSAPYGNGVALSPDGKLLASGHGDYRDDSRNSSIVLWDADTGKVLRETEPCKSFSTSSRVQVLWSANGRLLAAIALNTGPPFRTIQIWHADTGKLLWPGKEIGIEFKNIYDHFNGRFSDSDRLLALAGKTYRGVWQVEVWDVATGKLSFVWDFDKENFKSLNDGRVVQHVALSPSGEHMAMLAGPPPGATDTESVVQVYETRTGKPLHKVVGLARSQRVEMPDEAETLVLHPIRAERVSKVITGQAAVVNVRDGRVRFHVPYRFRPDEWAHRLPPVKGPYAPSPTHKTAHRFRDTLLIPDEIGLTRWDWKTGEKLDEYNAPLHDLAMSADGKRLAIREENRLAVSDGKLASLHAPDVFARGPRVYFLPDGRLLANDSSYMDGGLVTVWDPRKRILLDTRRVHPFRGNESDQNNDWRNLLDGHSRSRLARFTDGKNHRLVCYDLLTNEVCAVINEVDQYSGSLSEDGKRVLATRSEKDHLAVLWFDARNGRELGRHDIPWKNLQPMSEGRYCNHPEWLAEDGSSFGFGDVHGRLNVVDCAKNQVVLAVGIAPAGDARARPWLPERSGDQRLLWAAPALHDRSPEKIPRHTPATAEHALWDRKGRLLRRFVVPDQESFDRPSLSHDGRTAVIGRYRNRGRPEFFETATGRLRGWIDHELWRVVFSLDDTMLAASWQGNSVMLWDLKRPLSGKPVMPTPRNVEEADALWTMLGNPDPTESDRALWALVAAPDHALRMLQGRLRPVAPLTAQDVQRLQALARRLDSASFRERDAATRELLGMQETVVPTLRAARKSTRSLEHGRRLDAVIDQLQSGVESPGPIRHLREVRALEVLERIGGAKARQQVAAIAAGADAHLTYEAQLVLARWR